MKRIGAIVSLMIMVSVAFSGVAFAVTDLKIEAVTPKDGAKSMSMDNMGFKVNFNKNVYESKKANKNLCHIEDSKGKQVPVIVVANPKEKRQLLVLADTNNKKTKIKGKSKYTLRIDAGLKADDGTTLKEEFKSSFTTLNPQVSMWVSMGMMGVMVVAMVFLTQRDMKKKDEKAGNTPKEKTVNPYKEAKRTGKSVEEIVAADQKKKAKEKAKRERQKRENKVEIASENFRVKGPAPISKVGLKYKEPAQSQPKNGQKNQGGSKNKGSKQQQKKKKK